MFPRSQNPRSRSRVGNLRVFLKLVALVAATSLAACGGVPGSQGQPSDSGATRATPSGTGETSRLAGGELITFERLAPGAEEPDLYAIGPDGGEPWLLTSPGGSPHWSADGTMLAFGACLNPPDCTTAIALLERSSGGVVGIPAPDPDLFMACVIWEPSGEQLACEALSETDPTRNGVYTVRASDAGELTRVTSNPDGDDIPLAYSPDGTQLVLARTDPSRDEPENQALFVTPTSGGDAQRITPWGSTDDQASWSPDGQTIVFGTNGYLYRVNPSGDGLAAIPLTMPDGSTPATAFDVAFSPDGGRIVFSLGSPQPGIYTARLDGTDVEQLTSTEAHHANWGAAPDF